MKQKILVFISCFAMVACSSQPKLAGPGELQRATASTDSTPPNPNAPVDPKALEAAIEIIQENSRQVTAAGCGDVYRCGLVMIETGLTASAAGVATSALVATAIIANEKLGYPVTAQLVQRAAVGLFQAGVYTVAAGGAVAVAGAVLVVVTGFVPSPANASELDDGILASQANFDRLMHRDKAYVFNLAKSRPRLARALIVMADGILKMSKG